MMNIFKLKVKVENLQNETDLIYHICHHSSPSSFINTAATSHLMRHVPTSSLFKTNTRPAPLTERRRLCHPRPQFEIINRFHPFLELNNEPATEALDCQSLFSDPSFFFTVWLKEQERICARLEKQRKEREEILRIRREDLAREQFADLAPVDVIRRDDLGETYVKQFGVDERIELRRKTIHEEAEKKQKLLYTTEIIEEDQPISESIFQPKILNIERKIEVVKDELKRSITLAEPILAALGEHGQLDDREMKINIIDESYFNLNYLKTEINSNKTPIIDGKLEEKEELSKSVFVSLNRRMILAEDTSSDEENSWNF